MPRFRLSRVLRLMTLLAGTLISLLTLTAQHPGAAYFTLNCQPDSITFLHNHVPVLQPTVSQISPPLIAARQTGQNQPILSGNAVSVWALSSDELQIHFDTNPDGTKWIVDSGICGAIAQPHQTPHQAVAIAVASGDGSATAFAQVNAGQAIAQAGAVGNASAIAYAQSATGGSNMPNPITTDCTYTVQKGDTLFKIAQRYNTDVHTLAQHNHLQNISLLLVGQKLRVPCHGGAIPASYQPTPTSTAVVPDFSMDMCSPETIHIIASGDNLFRLAKRYGTSVEAIKIANAITDPTQIPIGTKLRIPCVG